MFQIKEVVSLIAMVTNDDIMLIYYYLECESATFPKNTGVEILQMRYRYTVIEFACSSSIGTWSPERCATNALSSNLFVVWQYRFEYRYLKS